MSEWSDQVEASRKVYADACEAVVAARKAMADFEKAWHRASAAKDEAGKDLSRLVFPDYKG